VSDIDFTLREELSALLDGALPEERAVELRRRLESDAALRKEYEELRRTVAVVRALPRPSAPPELRARLERKLMAPPATGIRRLRYRLAVAAVVTVAVGAGVLALRPQRQQAIHKEARKPDSRHAGETVAPPSAKPPAGLGDAPAKQVEAEALDERLGRPDHEPVAVPSSPAAPAEEKETSRREDAVPARSAKARRGAPAKGVVEDDTTFTELGGAGKGAARDAEQEGAAPTLLALAVQARVEPETRRLYLFQLSQLSSEKVWAHLNELTAKLVARRTMATALPPSANLTVTDLDEARQIFSVLRKFRGTVGRGAQATIVFPESGGRTPLLTAEVEVTPQQWQSVGRWLQLMDVTDQRARPAITVEEGRSQDPRKKKAAAKAEPKDGARSLDAAARDAKRKVKIFIRYPRAEAPAASAGKK